MKQGWEGGGWGCAQWLEALNALAEDSSLVPSIHVE